MKSKVAPCCRFESCHHTSAGMQLILQLITQLLCSCFVLTGISELPLNWFWKQIWEYGWGSKSWLGWAKLGLYCFFHVCSSSCLFTFWFHICWIKLLTFIDIDGPVCNLNLQAFWSVYQFSGQHRYWSLSCSVQGHVNQNQWMIKALLYAFVNCISF